MTDTPRTDAAIIAAAKELGWSGTYQLMTAHARELERENAALREALCPFALFANAVPRDAMAEAMSAGNQALLAGCLHRAREFFPHMKP